MDDVPSLVEHFLAKYRWSPDAIPTTITEEAMAVLQEHDWPGNVRELENAVERAVVLSRGAPIMPEHLPLTAAPVQGSATEGGPPRRGRRAASKAAAGADPDADADAAAPHRNGASEAAEGAGLKGAVAALEKRLIGEALARNAGNRSKAADELGIYRRLLYAKIREYGLGE
jgi:DNA-binding NtrC family response regulator